MMATESKTLSATGSMRLCISSFTDTIGFMLPQSAGSGLTPGAGALAAVEGDEHEEAPEARAISPGAAITFRARRAVISAPVQVVFTRRGGGRTRSAGVETLAGRSYQCHTAEL